MDLFHPLLKKYGLIRCPDKAMLFWDVSLFEFDNRNPSPAELYMFVVEATHAWDTL